MHASGHAALRDLKARGCKQLIVTANLTSLGRYIFRLCLPGATQWGSLDLTVIFPEAVALENSGADGAGPRRDFRSLLVEKLNSYGPFYGLCP